MHSTKKIEFTPEQLAEIRRLYIDEGESIIFIAKKFGVSVTVIRNRLDASIPILKPKKIKPPKVEEPKPKPKRRIVGVNI